MSTLFDVDPIVPPGFSYHPEFITEAEERDLIEQIANTHLHTFFFQGFEAKRKVASFGYDWSFEKKTLSKGKEIPPAFHWVLEKVAALLALRKEDIAELLLIEYPIGSVINWHRDAPPFDLIAGISLLSDCIFRLRPHEKSEQSRKATFSFPVARRSLYVMQGPARSEWQHSISPVKATRYSLTLRTLRSDVDQSA